MMDDLTDIREFYNAAWDAEANRLERHQLEADITWHYLNLYLPPRGRLLEISAEQSMVASSRHILYIGQRPDD